MFSLVYASQGLVSSVSDLRKATAAFDRVENILLNTNPNISELENGDVRSNGTSVCQDEESHLGRRRMRKSAMAEARKGDLVFRNVSFAYPMRPQISVLTNLNLTLERGINN